MSTKNEQLYCIFAFVFFISPLDDMNAILLRNKCSEKEVERGKYSKIIIRPYIKYIYFKIKRKLV